MTRSASGTNTIEWWWLTMSNSSSANAERSRISPWTKRSFVPRSRASARTVASWRLEMSNSVVVGAELREEDRIPAAAAGERQHALTLEVDAA